MGKQKAGLIELIALLTDMKNRKDELHKIYDKVRLIGPSVEYFLLEAAKRYVQANKLNRRSSTVPIKRTRSVSRSISPPPLFRQHSMEIAAIERKSVIRRHLSPGDEVIACRRLNSRRRDSPVLMKLLE